MLDGFAITLELALGSVALALLIAVARRARRVFASKPGLSAALFAYTILFRGTPLLAQLFLIYLRLRSVQPALSAAGLWWLFRDPFFCSLFTFTLNTAAYQTEIFAGAIRGVPAGQIEAARAAGHAADACGASGIILPKRQVLRYGHSETS